MVSDQILKAYFKTNYPEYKLLYHEKTEQIGDGSMAIVSVYRDAISKTYRLVAALYKEGDYQFLDDDRFKSGVYEEVSIARTPLITESLSLVVLYSRLKKKIFTSLCSNKDLPSVLSIGTSNGITVYYTVQGKLETSCVINGNLNIDLPICELQYLSKQLRALRIMVTNTKVLGGNTLDFI